MHSIHARSSQHFITPDGAREIAAVLSPTVKLLAAVTLFAYECMCTLPPRNSFRPCMYVHVHSIFNLPQASHKKPGIPSQLIRRPTSHISVPYTAFLILPEDIIKVLPVAYLPTLDTCAVTCTSCVVSLVRFADLISGTCHALDVKKGISHGEQDPKKIQ
jgi:hypothetical protein